MIKTIPLLGAFLALSVLLGCAGHAGSPDPAPGGGALGQSVADAAVSAVGAPYRYGGASPRTGFDCSGLVWWAYAKNGRTVPRSTNDLLTVGSAVSPAAAAPGDILVFDPGHGLHAGIALDGSRFVHSPKSGDAVRIERWDKGYWAQRVLSVRRP